jgi:hypothetical protein
MRIASTKRSRRNTLQCPTIYIEREPANTIKSSPSHRPYALMTMCCPTPSRPVQQPNSQRISTAAHTVSCFENCRAKAPRKGRGKKERNRIETSHTSPTADRCHPADDKRGYPTPVEHYILPQTLPVPLLGWDIRRCLSYDSRLHAPFCRRDQSCQCYS